jgi:hypothetical protein
MKRLGISILLVVSLLFSAIPSASAAVTPGTKCSKSGIKQTYKGKVYTCVKLGSKLYWNNGTKVKTAAPSTVSQKNWKLNGTEFRDQVLDIRNKLILSQEYKDAKLALELCSTFRKLLTTFPADTPRINLLRDADSNCPGVGFFKTAADKMYDWATDRVVQNLPTCGKASFSYELVDYSLVDGGSLRFKLRNTSTEDVTVRFFGTNLKNRIGSDTFPVAIPLKQGAEVTTVVRSEENYNLKNDPFTQTSLLNSGSVSEYKFGWIPRLNKIYYDLSNPKYVNSCTNLEETVETIRLSSCPVGNIEVKVLSLTPVYINTSYLNRWVYQLQFVNRTGVNVDVLISNGLVGGKKLDGTIIPSGITNSIKYAFGNYFYENSSWNGEGTYTQWLTSLTPGGSRNATAERFLLGDYFPKGSNGRELTGVSWTSYLNLESIKVKPLGNYSSCDSLPVRLAN